MKKYIKRFTILVLTVVAVLAALTLGACSLLPSDHSQGDSPTKYTVEFNTYGGSEIASVKVDKGSTIVKPDDPILDGYTLIGWYEDNNYVTEWNFETDKVTKNITLYAKWQKTDVPPVTPVTKYYTVTFNTNGGNSIKSVEVEENSIVTKPANPTRDGYTFDGWYKDSNCTTKWIFNIDKVTKNVTLYAKWNKIITEPDELEFTLSSDGNSYSVSRKYDVTYKTVNIPSTHNGKPVTAIGDFAFAGCSSLAKVVIPNSVTKIGQYAFQYCTNLLSITIGGGVKTVDSTAFESCTRVLEVYNLSTLSISKGSSSCGGVAKYARDVYTSSTAASKLSTDENGLMFYENGQVLLVGYQGTLSELNLPKLFKNKSYNIDSNAFAYCKGLASVIIPDGVTTIGGDAFCGCNNLTKITIPASVTTFGSEAFRYCTGITNVYFNGDAAKWCNINFDGYGANPLNNGAKLYINNSLVTELTIPTSVTTIKSNAFYGCASITKIIVGNNVTTISDYAFYKCVNVTSVALGSSVTEIGENAFAYCASLTSVTIPDSVTKVGNYAFSFCNSLTSATIGKGVKTLGWYAFYDNTVLAEIKFNGTTTQWNAITIGDYWNYSAPATQVTCTNGTVNL